MEENEKINNTNEEIGKNNSSTTQPVPVQNDNSHPFNQKFDNKEKFLCGLIVFWIPFLLSALTIIGFQSANNNSLQLSPIGIISTLLPINPFGVIIHLISILLCSIIWYSFSYSRKYMFFQNGRPDKSRILGLYSILFLAPLTFVLLIVMIFLGIVFTFN